jgi:hypothetical protein
MHTRIRRARSRRYYDEARPWLLLAVVLIVLGYVVAFLMEHPRARRWALLAGLLLLAIWLDHH